MLLTPHYADPASTTSSVPSIPSTNSIDPTTFLPTSPVSTTPFPPAIKTDTAGEQNS